MIVKYRAKLKTCFASEFLIKGRRIYRVEVVAALWIPPMFYPWILTVILLSLNLWVAFFPLSGLHRNPRYKTYCCETVRFSKTKTLRYCIQPFLGWSDIDIMIQDMKIITELCTIALRARLDIFEYIIIFDWIITLCIHLSCFQ